MSFELEIMRECRKIGISEEVYQLFSEQVDNYVLLNCTDYVHKNIIKDSDKVVSKYMLQSKDNEFIFTKATCLTSEIFEDFREVLFDRMIYHFDGESEFEEDREINRRTLERGIGSLYTFFEYKNVNFLIQSELFNNNCITTVCLSIER